MNMRIALGCLAVCAIVGGGRADAAEGFDALVQVVGNTLVVTGIPGGDRVMYMAKDGTLRGLIDGRPEAGRWAFSDGKLCFSKGGSSRQECGVLKVAGSTGTFEIEGHAIAVAVRPGDAVSGAGAAPAGAASPPAGGTAAGARASALVGNTIEGAIESKGVTTVFLDKDGTVRIRQDSRVIAGRWSTHGDTMCIDVQSRNDCFTVDIEATRVTLHNVKPDLPPLVFTLMKGNAANL